MLKNMIKSLLKYIKIKDLLKPVITYFLKNKNCHEMNYNIQLIIKTIENKENEKRKA